MDNEAQILALLEENRELAAKAYATAEKTRKCLLYTGIFTVLAFVLPLLMLLLYLPSFLSQYSAALGEGVLL